MTYKESLERNNDALLQSAEALLRSKQAVEEAAEVIKVNTKLRDDTDKRLAILERRFNGELSLQIEHAITAALVPLCTRVGSIDHRVVRNETHLGWLTKGTILGIPGVTALAELIRRILTR